MKNNDITRWRITKLIGQETQIRIAEMFGTTPATIGNYVNGKTKELPFKAIEKFAEIFSVSIDYVIGITDDKLETATENDRIRFLCFVYKDSKKITELSKKLGAHDLLHSHIRGEYEYFTPEKARAVADIFGIDIEWFTNGRVTNYTQTEFEQEEEKQPVDINKEFEQWKASIMAEVENTLAELFNKKNKEETK